MHATTSSPIDGRPRDNEPLMGMPDWWTTRRLGLFVHATAATVPAWAPIGQYAEWYRNHLGDDLPDVGLFPSPMVEVVAHHQERWGHIETYDDFVPLLTFDRFDAEDWARLARDAGAGYSVLVSKHHDGWSWWDAPGTRRRLTEQGPHRNVLSEYAAACERNDVVFGTYSSLLDWSDPRYGTDAYVDEVLHPQVLDLVERYGSSILWGDGHWGRRSSYWRSGELIAAARAINPDLVVNDRWRLGPDDADAGVPTVRTFEYATPDDIVDGPWELCRGVGASFGHNRNERAEHHMTAAEIVALYTEVVAKGGHLLLNVGPAADGSIPELQAAPLRRAGAWIRQFDDTVGRCAPWATWGDDTTRFVQSHDGAVHAVDLTNDGRLGGFDTSRHRVTSIVRTDDPDTPVDAVVTDRGLVVRSARPGGPNVVDGIAAVVYRIEVTTIEPPAALFGAETSDPVPLGPLLDGARPGEIVQLGDGTYLGPAVVPDGVVLRGLGADRTTILPDGTGPEPSDAAVTVSGTGRVEHLCVRGSGERTDWFPPAGVHLAGDRSTMFGCTVDTIVHVSGDDVALRAVSARGVVADDADRLSVSRCSFSGNRWDVGILLRRGGGHRIESSDFSDHLCAVRAERTTGTDIRHNTIDARWWGVHLDRTEDAHVHGNRFEGVTRAVDVDGGSNTLVDGNAAARGDSGCIVEAGAAHCTVTGNHWEQCRIGLLAWEAVDLDHRDNVCVDLHEPDAAAVLGP